VDPLVQQIAPDRPDQGGVVGLPVRDWTGIRWPLLEFVLADAHSCFWAALPFLQARLGFGS